MDELQIGITRLIKSAITGEKITVSGKFNWNRALEIAVKHQIGVLLYCGILNSDVDVPSELLKHFENLAYKSIALNHKQLYELEEIYNEFDRNGIDYMPIKGAVIKYLYPKPEMRVMCDADILIKPEQYDKIAHIMRKAEFKETIESDHEFVWDKNVIHIEFHKRLIPSYNKDYYAYYGDGWRLAKTDRGSRFKMSDEDTFVYIFTHFAKHYRDGGIGIRHITDFYVYLSAKPNMDIGYIESELAKLELLDFYNNTVHTFNVWFGTEIGDEMSDFITDKIFGSGSYGTYKSHVLSSAVKTSNSDRNVKTKKLFNLIFLPYKSMCKKYPILKKFPMLLPIMWVLRGINAVVYHKDRIARQQRDLKIITDDNVKKYKQELNYVGLKFNFKE